MPHVPLAGLRVLVTRPAGDGADDWAAALIAAGAEPVPYPTVAILPPPSWQSLDEALARIDGYDWLIFTSKTTVKFVVGRWPNGRFPAVLPPKIAAVGQATARAITDAGGVAEVVPADQRQEGLVEVLGGLARGTRVLLPIAAAGRALLPESLRALGCVVDVVTAYRTEPRTDLPPPPPFDAAIFASPSALRAFLAGAGHASLAGKLVVAVGPTTAGEAAAHGISATLAVSPAIDALISTLAENRPRQGES